MIIFAWNMDYNDFNIKNGIYEPKISGTGGQERIFCLASGDYFDYSSIVTEKFDFLIFPNLRLDFKGNNHI